MHRLTLWLFCSLVAACSNGGLQPYVTHLSEGAADRTASDIAAFVTQQVPTGSIAVDRAPDDQVLWPRLAEDLRAAGYTVSDGHARHHLRFAVETLEDEILLRASIDGTSVAQLYRTASGNRIEPSGPGTIITAEVE